jgi:hypothetical protein
MYTAK